MPYIVLRYVPTRPNLLSFVYKRARVKNKI